jgi:hypothetical protein
VTRPQLPGPAAVVVVIGVGDQLGRHHQHVGEVVLSEITQTFELLLADLDQDRQGAATKVEGPRRQLGAVTGIVGHASFTRFRGGL